MVMFNNWLPKFLKIFTDFNSSKIPLPVECFILKLRNYDQMAIEDHGS